MTTFVELLSRVDAGCGLLGGHFVKCGGSSETVGCAAVEPPPFRV